ncbi:uncharacterized protein [Blastocystis hominis]|uniref:Uncharacterized protein n=1 Tax=Blastocystis hominis TaxID=12968 RepID=D8LW57_BLAHO|nr:uncharacterized protein [Blastocystis hominis]CBK20046.2 unnamed protein product [Blastocystis hominis]|eukprot:XP_012894094.1 uncharacterized protein [Blastocystis hominis]
MVETQLWILLYLYSFDGEPRANTERASFRAKGGDKDQVTLLHFPALQWSCWSRHFDSHLRRRKSGLGYGSLSVPLLWPVCWFRKHDASESLRLLEREYLLRNCQAYVWQLV